MNKLRQLLFSIIATLLVSFFLSLGGLLLLLGGLQLGQLSPFATIFVQAAQLISEVLNTFGSGNIWQGMLIISLTLSLVGGLFDAFAFYKYQALKS
ncbi:MAG: hypothetical protein AAF152_18685 [Cyanobacteria bacterium P01_A01_bin.114]